MEIVISMGNHTKLYGNLVNAMISALTNLHHAMWIAHKHAVRVASSEKPSKIREVRNSTVINSLMLPCFWRVPGEVRPCEVISTYFAFVVEKGPQKSLKAFF